MMSPNKLLLDKELCKSTISLQFHTNSVVVIADNGKAVLIISVNKKIMMSQDGPSNAHPDTHV